MHVFTVMINSDKLTDLAFKKDISCEAKYQLIYGPVPVRGPVFGDL